MYGIFLYIWSLYMANVGKYAIHGCYGNGHFESPGSQGTVDGKKTAPVEVGGLSQYLQGFMHPRCCRVASINSMTGRLGSVLVLF